MVDRPAYAPRFGTLSSGLSGIVGCVVAVTGLRGMGCYSQSQLKLLVVERSALRERPGLVGKLCGSSLEDLQALRLPRRGVALLL